MTFALNPNVAQLLFSFLLLLLFLFLFLCAALSFCTAEVAVGRTMEGTREGAAMREASTPCTAIATRTSILTFVLSDFVVVVNVVVVVYFI